MNRYIKSSLYGFLLFLENLKNIKSKAEEYALSKSTEEKISRSDALRKAAFAFKDCLRYGEENVALAVQTYDMVDFLMNSRTSNINS